VVSSVNQLVNTRDVSRGLPGLLRTIIHQIRLVVSCNLAAVALYNEHDDSFTLETVYSDTVRDWSELPPPQCIPAANTPWQSARNNHGPVEQRDLARSVFPYDRQLAAIGMRSSVVVPIGGGERTFGALGFASRQADSYGHAQVMTLMEISRQLGTMLHKERLSREREETAIALERSKEHLNMVEKVRLVGQLASGVAHDFNNLLAGVLGNAQLLLLEVDNPDQREMLQVIERAAKDGTETVRRIQGFARMHKDDEMTEVRLDLLARDAIDITRPRWRDVAQSRGATIEIVRNIQAVDSIYGQAAPLREVFSNLIINASDAMPRGGALTVSTYNKIEDGAPPAVVVEVADTGTGIAPEVRDKMFDPFFTTKGEKGTGLGLSVSLEIVQRHGGTIAVESEVGQGTRFIVQLPVAQLKPSQQKRDQRRLTTTRPGHILFVESETMIRVPIMRILKHWGHTVTEAAGGAEALQKFSPGAFDIVISDLGMPDMNGWDVLAQIKARDPRIPTVLLTGWGRPETDDRSQNADYILEKPFDQDQLRDVLADAMAERSGQSGAV
jgi:signal transduction histidine kinase/CheY-like chemotaxis protein